MRRIRIAAIEVWSEVRRGKTNIGICCGILILAAGADLAVHATWNAARDLPYRDPGQLVRVTVVGEEVSAKSHLAPHPFDDEVALIREDASSFSWIGGWSGTTVFAGSPENGRMAFLAMVAPGTFDALGADPVAGRTFSVEDHPSVGSDGREDSGISPVILRSDFAAALFGEPTRAVGARIPLTEGAARVIGVMPAGFVFPDARTVGWLAAPLRTERRTRGSFSRFAAPTMARLTRGVSREEAEAEATAILRHAGLRSESEAIRIRPLLESVTESVRPPLLMLRTGSLLLLIAAATASANFRMSGALAGSSAREVRRFVGAEPMDELRATGFRILLMGCVIGAGAQLVARPLLGILVATAEGLPHAGEWRWDSALWLHGSLVALAAASAAEIPAEIEASRRRDRIRAVRPGFPGLLRLPLLAAGVATCTVMWVGTAVLAGSAWTALAGRGGYSDSELAVLTVDFGGSGMAFRFSALERARLLDSVSARLEALAKVRTAAYADALPDDPRGSGNALPESGGGPPSDRILAIRRIGPRFLQTLGVPIVEGRGLTPADRPPAEPVGVVDQRFARRFEGAGAIRHWVRTGHDEVRIVGIASDVMTFPAEDRWRTLYVPYGREPARSDGGTADRVEIVVRLGDEGSPGAIAAARRVPREVHPSFRVLAAETMRRRRVDILGGAYLVSALLAIFAVCGLLLGGVAGIGQIVEVSIREAPANAIRSALGASPARIARQLTSRTFAAGSAGTGVGLVLGWYAMQRVSAGLPWTRADEPMLYLGPAALMGILLAACYSAAALRFLRRTPQPLLRSL